MAFMSVPPGFLPPLAPAQQSEGPSGSFSSAAPPGYGPEHGSFAREQQQQQRYHQQQQQQRQNYASAAATGFSSPPGLGAPPGFCAPGHGSRVARSPAGPPQMNSTASFPGLMGAATSSSGSMQSSPWGAPGSSARWANGTQTKGSTPGYSSPPGFGHVGSSMSRSGSYSSALNSPAPTFATVTGTASPSGASWASTHATSPPPPVGRAAGSYPTRSKQSVHDAPMVTSPPSSIKSLAPPPSADGSQQQPLSREAEKFVPTWLQDVNKVTPQHVFRRSRAEAGEIDLDAAVAQLYPSATWRARAEAYAQAERGLPDPFKASAIRIERPTESAAPSAASPPLPPGLPPRLPSSGSVGHSGRTSQLDIVSRSAHRLSRETYANAWLELMRDERRARLHQTELATMFDCRLEVAESYGATSSTGAAPPTLFALDAPSIREGWPPVELGDVVNLRQIHGLWTEWPGYEFEATVWEIRRAAGQVILRCEALKAYHAEHRYNVLWKVSNRPLQASRHALVSMHSTLNAEVNESGPRQLLERWLFPTRHDLLFTPQVEPYEAEIDWQDGKLNVEQRRAVRSILTGTHPVPFLLWGPPGSGKTKTLVETVLQITKVHPQAHVLVCGASNPSADTLLRRLAAHLKPEELFRLNDASRPIAEMGMGFGHYCHMTEDGRFELPPLDVLLKKRVIVTSCTDASILTMVGCSNSSLAQLEKSTFDRLHPLIDNSGFRFIPHFQFLLIDEAAQASEPEVAIPLNAVSVDSGICFEPRVVICGDPKQLGPVIVSEEARLQGLDTSMLERLLDSEVYAEHPASRRHRRRLPPDDLERFLRAAPFCDLTKNYRSAVPILMFPSATFYSDTLEPFAPASVRQSQLRKWSRLRNDFPVLFRGVLGKDEMWNEGASWFNEAEVREVVDLIVDLLTPSTSGDKDRHGSIQPREISVITPEREQVWRIRLALRARHLSDVDVGNVESLQGAENRVVIISTCRSTHPKGLESDRRHGRGLIFEPRRLNVALTRAQELMVVVGNPHVLATDPHWRSFMRFCARNDCYVGPQISSEDDLTAEVDEMSRLEQMYRAGTEASGEEADLERDHNLMIGGMMRQTLADGDD